MHYCDLFFDQLPGINKYFISDPIDPLKKRILQAVKGFASNERGIRLDDMVHLLKEVRNYSGLMQKVNSCWMKIFKHLEPEEQDKMPALLFEHFGEELRLPEPFEQFKQTLMSKEVFFSCLTGKRRQHYFQFAFSTCLNEKSSVTDLLFYLFSLFREVFSLKQEEAYIKSFLSCIKWLLDCDCRVQHYHEGQTTLEVFELYCIKLFKLLGRSIPPGFEELHERIKKLDGGFTQEKQYRELIAHLFEVGGKSKLHQFQIDLGGISATILSDFFEKVYRYYNEARLTLIEAHHADRLVLKKTYEVEQDKDCFIFGHTDRRIAHSLGYVRFREYIFIGNQGMNCGLFPGILILKINPNKFCSENFNEINFSLEKEDYINFINQEALKEMEAQIYGYIPLMKQKVANCATKVVLLNLFSVIFLSLAYEDLNDFKEALKKHLIKTHEIFKLVDNEVKLEILKQYNKLHQDPNFKQPFATKLIQDIER